jgi:DNA repair exonuclease SbcCD nuclease subunit
MPEILFFSDVHIAAHKGSQDRLEDCLKVLQWVFDTARKRKIKNIVFGGDLFQDRQKIQVLAYNKTFNVLNANPDINLYLLLGNHDLWFYESKEISSVHPFAALKNVTVVSEPSTVMVGDFPIDFLPFTHNPINTLKNWKAKKSNVLIGHIAVDGAVLNFNHRTKAEVSVENENDMVPVSRDLFDGWNRVFLGHYHGAQKLTDKVEYIGSPLQLTFNEAFQEKHILAMDTETLETIAIVNDFSPKHLILDAVDLPEDLGRNFVRVYVDDLNSADVVDLQSKVRSTSPDSQVTFLPKEIIAKEESKEDRMLKFNLQDGDLFQRFISASNTQNLDTNDLLKIAQEICAE